MTQDTTEKSGPLKSRHKGLAVQEMPAKDKGWELEKSGEPQTMMPSLTPVKDWAGRASDLGNIVRKLKSSY